MAVDTKNVKRNDNEPLWPRSRPSQWIVKANGDLRLASILFACSEHVWLTQAGGRAYLAACRAEGVDPELGWTSEDILASRRLSLADDWNWTDPEAKQILKRFTDEASRRAEA